MPALKSMLVAFVVVSTPQKPRYQSHCFLCNRDFQMVKTRGKVFCCDLCLFTVRSAINMLCVNSRRIILDSIRLYPAGLVDSLDTGVSPASCPKLV